MRISYIKHNILYSLLIISCVLSMILLCIFVSQNSNKVNALNTPYDGSYVPTTISTVSGQAYSSSNPYAISSASDLISLAYRVNVQHDRAYATATYIMQNHIDLSAYNWIPIGTMIKADANDTPIPFSGVFDGNGYSIYGLTINNQNMDSDNDYCYGLFGKIEYYYDTNTSTAYIPKIQLLGLKNVSINCNACYVGAIAGSIVGDNTTGVAYNSVSGATASAVIQECYVVGKIIGATYTGGIVGQLSDMACIYNCYTAPSASNNGNDDIYSTLGDGSTGGIVGVVPVTNNTYVYLKNCYSTCKVNKNSNTTNVGGIIGLLDNGTKTNYRSNIYCSNTTDFNSATTVGLAKTIIQMKSISVYNLSYTGWNIDNMGNSIKNFVRGSNPTSVDNYTTWQLSSLVNNGFPILTRVREISLVQLNSSIVDISDSSSMVTPSFVGSYDSISIDSDKIYVEQGTRVTIKALLVSSGSTPDYDDLYKFDTWYLQKMNSNVSTNNTETTISMVANPDNAVQVMVNSDAIYTAKFVDQEYDIIYQTDANRGIVKAKYSTNGTLGSVNWSEIEYSSGNSISVPYGSIVRLEGVANVGYQVSSWNLNSSTILDSQSNTYTDAVYEFQLNSTATQTFYLNFEQKNYNFSFITNNSSVATLSYTVNGGSAQTASITNAHYGDIIKLYTNISNNNYNLLYYTVQADNLTQYNLSSDSLVIGDYDNYIVNAYIESNKYAVTIAINDNALGSVSFVGDLTSSNIKVVAFNEQCEIQVSNIGTGYHLEKWIIESNGNTTESTDNTVTLSSLTYNTRVTAVIAINKYTITIHKANATQGSISVNSTTIDNDYIIEQVSYNTNYTLVATCLEGYNFVRWKDANDNTLGTNLTLQYNVKSNIDIYADFENIIYTVTIYAKIVGGDNSVKLGRCSTQTNINGYRINETVSFSAIAPVNYTFDHWEMRENNNISNDNYKFGVGNVAENGIIYSIRSNLVIDAYFKTKTVRVSYGINNTDYGDYSFVYYNNGDITKQFKQINDNVYDYTYDITKRLQLLNATPVDGNYYTFVCWTINNVPVSNNTSYTTELSSSLVSSNNKINICAVFRPKEFPVTVSQYIDDITQSVDCATISGLESNYYIYGSNITLDVVTKTGYRFAGWYYSNGTPNLELINEEHLTNYKIRGVTRLYAKFDVLGIVCVESTNNNAGNISGIGTYIVGTRVDLNAVASEGYRFSHWELNDEIVSKNTTYQVIVKAVPDKLKAVFIELKDINIIVNDKMGYVTGLQDTSVGSTATIKAMPASDCSFIGWYINDCLVSSNNEYSFIVNGDMDIQAIFKRDFNWSAMLVIIGCMICAILTILFAIGYVQNKEKELVISKAKKENDRFLLIPRAEKLDMSKIQPVPVKKIEHIAIDPVPVRKIVVVPKDYKGNIKTVKCNRKEQVIEKSVVIEQIQKIEEPKQEKKLGRGRPAGSLNKKGKKPIIVKHPGQKGRPAGSLNKKGKKVVVVQHPGQKGRPKGSKNKK